VLSVFFIGVFLGAGVGLVLGFEFRNYLFRCERHRDPNLKRYRPNDAILRVR